MNGAQFRGENENLSSSADVVPKTSNLVISRCCFSEINKDARAERAKLLLLLSKYANLRRSVAVAVVVAKAP